MVFVVFSMKTELVLDGHIVLKLANDGTGKGATHVVAVATKETTKVEQHLV